MLHLLVALLVGCTDARLARGTLSGVTENFEVLANFCFDFLDPQPTPRVGTGLFEFTASAPNGRAVPDNLMLVAFNDRDDWPLIYDTSAGRFLPGLTCQQRLDAAEQHIDMPVTAWDELRSQEVSMGIRPMFWYIALTCCGCEEGAMNGLEYELHMTNSLTGWPERMWEFGVDEKGLQDLFLWYFFGYLVLLALHYVALKKYTAANGSIHKFMLIFSAVLALEFISVLFNMGHWFAYGRNGFGDNGSRGFATFLNIVSRIVFAGLLILLAQGYQITAKFIPVKEKSGLMAVFGLLAFMYIVQIFWEFVGREPEHVNPPIGERWLVAILNLVWIAFTFWFGRLCHQSYSSSLTSGEKKQFYFRLGLFTLWMGSLPIVNFAFLGIAATHYVRGTTITNITFTTFAYAYFTYMTWPNKETATVMDAPDAQVYNALPGSASGSNLLANEV